jgi:hypothetical protein
MTQLSTFTFQRAGELEKESEAKKGITKLMLLHIFPSINYKELSVTNIIFATLSKGMEVVLNQLCAACLISLVDLIRPTLVLTKDHDHFSI